MNANELAEAILIVIRKIGKWIFIAASICLVLFLSFLGYVYIDSYYQNRPKLIEQLGGVALGDSLSDFVFKNPGYVLEKPEEKTSPGEKELVYTNKETLTTVTIEKNKISMVVYVCKNEGEYTVINGVSCGESSEAILEKYGSDARAQCLKDKNDKSYSSYRVYDAPKFGVRHHVFSNKVGAFQIMPPAELIEATGVSWGPCP